MAAAALEVSLLEMSKTLRVLLVRCMTLYCLGSLGGEHTFWTSWQSPGRGETEGEGLGETVFEVTLGGLEDGGEEVCTREEETPVEELVAEKAGVGSKFELLEVDRDSTEGERGADPDGWTLAEDDEADDENSSVERFGDAVREGLVLPGGPLEEVMEVVEICGETEGTSVDELSLPPGFTLGFWDEALENLIPNPTPSPTPRITSRMTAIATRIQITFFEQHLLFG